jgi:hypothetical protein
MGESEVGTFLSSLARDRAVSASTQNQALAALLFLYARVLERKLGWVEGVTRAKMPERLPVVLGRADAATWTSSARSIASTWSKAPAGSPCPMPCG